MTRQHNSDHSPRRAWPAALADHTPPEAAREVIDPVCFMPVSPHSPHHTEHRGRLYMFCSQGCQLEFQQTPDWFLQGPRTRLIRGRIPDGREIGGEPVFAQQTAENAGGQDPVCRMLVGAESPHRLTHDGETLWFCTERCLETFRAWPARYLGATGRGRRPAASEDSGGSPWWVFARFCRSRPRLRVVVTLAARLHAPCPVSCCV